MSSEASPAGFGPEAVGFPGFGASEPGRAGWQGVERSVLLSKLRALEERTRRLEYLETRLRDLNREVQMLTRLAEATHTIHDAQDIAELLDTALGQCLELLQARCGSICMRGPEEEELVVARASGPHRAAVEGACIPLGQGVAGYVAASREPVQVADINADGRFARRDSDRYATGSFLSVPVLDGNGVHGVINVADRRDGQPFGEQDLRTALRLAQDLAAAIERVRRLEASQARHQQFVSKLAHELRNPLDGVLRFINLTLADQHPEERKRRYLLASKQGLERLTGIVNSLTGFYRGACPPEELASVNDLAVQAVQLQEGKAEQRGIDVELELADDLPPIPGGGALFQVFTNLVSNACDAMKEGGGTLTVRTSRVDGSVHVQVADTGCGMPQEVLERVFTPFFTTKAPGKGMGLGLAVCREVVGRLQGQIEVASEPGQGTAFTVRVPCPSLEGATGL